MKVQQQERVTSNNRILTIIFIVLTTRLYPFSYFSINQNDVGTIVSITSLVALLACLAPTTIGFLLSSIGIARMSRLNRKNVIATSGREYNMM